MEQDIHIRFKLTNEHVTLCKVVNIKKRLCFLQMCSLNFIKKIAMPIKKKLILNYV